MHPSRLAPRLRSAAAVALFGLFGAANAFGQAEPSLLSPATQTPAVTKAAPADRVVTRQRPVELNMAPLKEKASRGGTAFVIELFDNERVTVDTFRVEQRSENNFTYFGKVRGQPRSEVVLTFVDGYLSADIVLEPGRRANHYRIQAQPDTGHWLQEIDGAAFPPDHPSDADSLPTPRMDKLLQGSASPDAVAADAGTTVDLMVVYSNQTAAAASATIGSQIQAAVDRANLAYANTGISFRLRLVHHAQVSYNESGNWSTELSRLAGSTDGYMDNVHSLRNTYGADMVSLFVEASSACGIGYIGPSSGSAFTVVSRGCAAGNLTLAHEIGHNFGARHDPYVDSSISPYAYGHGYTYPAASWRTVMAYNDACTAVGKSCTRVAYFSNPNVTYGGVPTGTPASGTSVRSHNSKVHNDNAYTVANFRQAVTGGCSYALSPTSASVAASGASGSTAVTAGSGCAWNTASNASWLTVGSASGTSGSGTLNYVAAANTGPARNAAISVGGVPFTVSQASGCTYTVSPTSANATAAGGTATVSVTTTAGCTWTATSGASWMSVTGGASGSGNGTVTYSVAANTGALRTGNLTVAGKTVTVTQAAPTSCTYAFSPTSASVAASGASGSTSVTAGTGCAWNASSNASWLTVGSGSATSGSGTLNYVAAANTGPPRSGAISVGGVVFSVSQASGCTYTVSPTSASATAAGGTASVSVTTSAGCTWTAATTVSWMTIASGASGSGNGTVTYNVAANTGAQRTGNLTVAGRTVAVTQSAPTPTASATLTPTTMDFGAVQIGKTSLVTTAVYNNTGSVAITVATLAHGGPHVADFVPRNACYVGLVLQPGQTCALGYAFSPKGTGSRNATASIGSEAGTKSISLSGTGRKSNNKK